jgi:hypothetical protein
MTNEFIENIMLDFNTPSEAKMGSLELSDMQLDKLSKLLLYIPRNILVAYFEENKDEIADISTMSTTLSYFVNKMKHESHEMFMSGYYSCQAIYYNLEGYNKKSFIVLVFDAVFFLPGNGDYMKRLISDIQFIKRHVL